MTPAAELHAAAAKLREEATTAWGELCLPPWQHGNSWAGAHTVMCQDGHPLAVFGEVVGGSPGLVEAQARYAATVHPGVGLLLADLLDAARLGLEPGTEQYYLTPRKVKGQLEILGIVGYQGYIELMYRAGAISSVIAEVVHAKDTFRYQPGRDDVPFHEIDWDSDDRGPLRLAYAYARMKDGSVSKVVVLNKTAIERIKKSSQGADSDYSPWRNHEAAMWTKSAVRQLAKWVPTSAEYIQARARAAATATGGGTAPLRIETDEVLDGEVVDEDTGEITEAKAT